MNSFLFSLILLLPNMLSGVTSLSEQELKDKTLQDLWLMRNEIYARHGMPLKTYELFAYFKGQGWYEPSKDYNDSMLSPAEKKNIDLIARQEKELLKHNYISSGNKINFDNVINRFQFGDFTKDEVNKLSTNGFCVIPAKNEQFFHIYDDNTYKGIANFVTTDAILQLYHIFFDVTLRKIEEEKLAPILQQLIQYLMENSKEIYTSTNNKLLKEAAKRNIAYFSVPYYFSSKGEITKKIEAELEKWYIQPGDTTDRKVKLRENGKTIRTGTARSIQEEVRNKLDHIEIDSLVKTVVNAEIEKCMAHEDAHGYPVILNPSADPNYHYQVDYTLFVPRGHYTRNEILKHYFLAMSWFGIYSLHPDIDLELIQSLLITHMLYKDSEDTLWQKIYEPTCFYVGFSDDLGPDDYKAVIDKVFGKNYTITDFINKGKLVEVRRQLKDIFDKKTKVRPIEITGLPQSIQFRFMGQRYIPDSEIMQRLIGPMPFRMPKGLDVMAVLGSRLAKKLMLEEYKKDWANWEEYPDTLEVLINKFSSLQPSDWHSNLYYNWLWSLKSLIELSNSYKYPFFMNNNAYLTRNLNTALASWTELRHDAILYSRQGAAECGEGGNEKWVWFPDPQKGYIEPNVEFYKRTKELLIFNRNELKKLGLISEFSGDESRRWESLVGSDDFLGYFNQFIGIVDTLGILSLKELNNEPLTVKEYDWIRHFGGILEKGCEHDIGRGGMLERLTLDAFEAIDWGELQGPDKRVPLVADVFRIRDKVEEEAVGYVNEIYVIVEIEGKLKLTRGGVFSYYEFNQPASDRLTDEKWQGILESGKEPPLPGWIENYQSSGKEHKLPKPVYVPEYRAPAGWYKIYY